MKARAVLIQSKRCTQRTVRVAVTRASGGAKEAKDFELATTSQVKGRANEEPILGEWRSAVAIPVICSTHEAFKLPEASR
ncbi:unnamed protein product [Lampetra planeri]